MMISSTETLVLGLLAQKSIGACGSELIHLSGGKLKRNSVYSLLPKSATQPQASHTTSRLVVARCARAGLPVTWKIGDKTGTNKTDSNDIGVVWPPGQKPWLVTAYLADSTAKRDVKDATLAQVGALVQQLATL